jgi:hypothetical protein
MDAAAVGSEGGIMKTLTLSLKKQWFDLIKAGVKKEEYREINRYWIARLVAAMEPFTGTVLSFTNFDTLVFTLGYPKADDSERRLEFKNPKIRIGTGKPEWGAEPGKTYFVISWEE